MSKNNNQYLFQLVCSLKPAEKRFFIEFSKSRGLNKYYLNLFQIMAKTALKRNQGEIIYDEKEVLHKAAFTNSKKLPKIKKYLYDRIMEALDLYHSHTANHRILTELRMSSILWRKGLYEQAWNKIQRAKEGAIYYQQFALLMNVLRQEMFFLQDQQTTLDVSRSYIDDLIKLEKETIEKYANYIGYAQLLILLRVHTKKTPFLRKGEQEEEFGRLPELPALKDENQALSFHAKYMFHNLLANYYEWKGDEERHYLHSKSNIELFDANPRFIPELPKSYLTGIINRIISCFRIHKYAEVSLLLEKMKAIPAEDRETEVKIFVNLYGLEIAYHTVQGDFGSILRLVPKIEEGLKQHKEYLSAANEQILCSEIAVVYFVTGEYRKSLDWVNRILNLKQEGAREDIYALTRIFQILVHFELGNMDILDSIILSTYRFLKKKKMLFKFENTVLSFIRSRILPLGSREELQDIFRDLKKELDVILKDPAEKPVQNFFDFSSWLESKITGRTLEEILKEKVKM